MLKLVRAWWFPVVVAALAALLLVGNLTLLVLIRQDTDNLSAGQAANAEILLAIQKDEALDARLSAAIISETCAYLKAVNAGPVANCPAPRSSP